MAGKQGTYRLCHTYARYNDAGVMVYESGRSPVKGPITVTGTTSYGFTAPTDTQMNRARVYSTLNGGAVYYLEHVETVVAGSGQQWVTLSMPDSTLKVQATAYFTNKGYENKRLYTSGVLPPLRYVVAASRRLWGAGRMHRTGTNEDATLYWSELAPDYRDWPVTNGNSIFAKPITGIYTEREIVYVFTRDTRWRVTPAAWNEGMEFDQLDPDIGCLGHHTVANLGKARMWMAEDGFYATAGDNRPEKVSGDIERTFNSIRKDRALQFVARARRQDQIYECYVSIDDWATCDTLIQYDYSQGIANGRWHIGPSKGRTGTYLASGVSPTGKRIYFLGDHLGCVWQEDIGTSDGANDGGTYQGKMGYGTTTTTTTSTTTTSTT